MNTMQLKTKQARDTGKYTHGMDKVCECGKTKGEHLAAFPFPSCDDTCQGFKLHKRDEKTSVELI